MVIIMLVVMMMMMMMLNLNMRLATAASLAKLLAILEVLYHMEDYSVFPCGKYRYYSRYR